MGYRTGALTDSQALEALAGAVPGGHYSTALITGPGRLPWLAVVSRGSPSTEAAVNVLEGWYWAWGERVAPVADPAAAAAAVTGLLRPAPAGVTVHE